MLFPPLSALSSTARIHLDKVKYKGISDEMGPYGVCRSDKVVVQRYFFVYERTAVREILVIVYEGENTVLSYVRRKGKSPALKGSHSAGAMRRCFAAHEI